MKLTTIYSTLPLLFTIAAGLPATPCPGPSSTAAAVAPTAAPAPADPAPPANGSPGKSLLDVIKAVEPTTTECPRGNFPDECATAEVAAAAIEKSFTKYQITNINEKAALLSLIMLESGNFSYSKNHYPDPGNPAQGTRNMQSPAFNKQYAEAVFGQDNQEYKTALSADSSGAEIVVLLNEDDELSFGSAAWFITSQTACQGARKAFQDASDPAGVKDAHNIYLKDCVGAPADEKRDWLFDGVSKQMTG